MKTAFFGTSDRSIPILNSLNKTSDLKIVITKRDVRVGRDQKLKETGVKSWAKSNKVKFIEIDSFKDLDFENVLHSLHEENIEYGIVADFAFMIPEKIIDFFETTRLINIHFSLLPAYRGASPVQFSILNGDEHTGITLQLVHRKMDAGAILYQIGYKMTYYETSGELYETLFNIAADKLPEILENYCLGKITPLPQDESKATYTFSKTHPQHTFIYKEDAFINFKDGAQNIYRQIRAYNPWPISWSYLKELENNPVLSNKFKLKKYIDKDLTVKIHSANLIEDKLDITEIQVEGKRKMSWKEFENGYIEQ